MGEGAGEVQKKYSHHEKINEKSSYTPINLKKYSCYGLKKLYKEFDNEKNIPAAWKFSTPSPITFLMVRP